jgi:hypothetical protein
MAAKKDPALDLAQAMLDVLARQHDQGQGAYPLSLQRLVELTNAAAPADLVAKAIKKKPFTAQVLVVQPKDPNSPVALLSDAQALANSDLLLDYVLNTVCTATKPTVEAGKVASKVPKALKVPFADALQVRLGNQQLPPGVALVTVGKKQHLHLTRFPLPLPPEEVLARQLVKTLETRRQRGGDGYPARLSELTAEVQPQPTTALLKKALAHAVFQQSVLVAAKQPDAPAALHGDIESLADSPLLLETVLRLCRSAMNQAATVAELKKKAVTALQPALEVALRRRLDSDTLPPTVGWLLQKKKPLLFLLADVHATLAAPTPHATTEPIAPIVDFRTAFEAAFDQFDQRQGGHNLVSLVELRRALPVDRASFDAGLQELRRAGRYTLSAVEGRHGIQPEEQSAGIREDGTLLLFVSRRVDREV